MSSFALKLDLPFPLALVTVLRLWQLFALSSSLRSAAVAGGLMELAGNQCCGGTNTLASTTELSSPTTVPNVEITSVLGNFVGPWKVVNFEC